ncbi:MAG TPA: hypothetical protein DEP35_15680 [Deltaproteobacteria bacterium]|jgi:hypothetical protein|nr:hypothetical protein [Deltaproteobacteria bacterium]
MELHHSRIHGLWRIAGLTLSGLLAVLSAGTARAVTCPGGTGCFVYNSGNLVGVFVNSGQEYIANLGALTSLTNGEVFNLSTTGANLGTSGGIGGIFTAFETNPGSGTGATIVFTTDAALTPQPPAYDSNAIITTPTYTAGIGASQPVLDGGTGIGWLQQLNSIPTSGTGVNFVTPTALGLNASTNPNSYSNVLGLGTNTIDNNMPFSTAATLSGNGQVLDLWSANTPKHNVSTTTLLGTLTVDGNSAGDGSTLRITFTAVPEPGTFFLLAGGLSGLVWMGQRRRTA